MAGKIQNEDIKSVSELTGAGGSASQLPNDDKVYVTANSINKTLKQAIIDGDIGAGGGTTPSQIRLTVGNGHGSTNTKIRRFTNTVENSGSHITYTDSSTNGASFTINTAGVYAITYTEEGSASFPVFGLSKNSSQLTTDLNAINVSDILAISNVSTGNDRQAVCAVVSLAVNDVIRMHTNNGSGTFVDNVQVFSMVGPLEGVSTGSGYTVTASKTANYSANSNEFIPCNATGGAFNVTLPTATSGRKVTIKKTDSSNNAVTVIGTIDGATNTTLNTQNEVLEVVADGTNWLIVDRVIPKIWSSWAPTGAFTTNTTYTGRWRRVGNHAEYEVRLAFSGAPNSVSATIDLPSGHVIDTSAPTGLLDATSNRQRNLGNCQVGDNFFGEVGFNTTTNVYLYAEISAADCRQDNVTQAQPITLNGSAGTNYINVTFDVPISGWKA